MGSAINLDEIKRFEVTEVYSHPDAKVDIVLVHGLNGDPRRTWTAKENGTFWPTQLLPVSLKSAQARILVYGYNADVYAFGNNKSASSDMIHHHAQSLIANLALERKSEEVETNPIIFVAHSLGGILVKRALELSNDLTSKNADDNRSIFVSTYGIIFLGTPHNGADPAKWGVILQGMVSALVPKKIMHSESQLVKTLQSNNETLQNINLHFLDIYQKFKICMVHEAAPTDIKGSKAFVVDKDSAAPMLPDVVYFGIEASHSGMCKFESKNSPGYMNISITLKSWVQECGPIIQARWENERRQRWQVKQAQAAELLGTFPSTTPQGSTSGNTPDLTSSMNSSTIIVKSTASIAPENSQTEDSQLFIKPSGFRPNSLFVGRQAEMLELHRMLFDEKRRADGTSAVLIQSMPGGGKSHLAREYVYRYKAKYPGGIFWLRAKSMIELAAGYWEIARKAALLDLEEQPEAFGADEKESERYIRVVRRWFNKRRDWLMVLDGIHFNDAQELQKYIPDSVDTGLIYTSLEKSVSGNHLFMNPQVIKLPLLSAREAQRLLLLELDRREPFSQEDLKNSMQLVLAMEFLPVVIHAVAQRLKSTEEPLARFVRNYASEPRLRGINTYRDVVKQLNVLGASETLNLMYILCFFSQHIPVEMISLGLRALDLPYHVPVKASEPVSGRSLNNTFKMLNTFALIERNEHESVHSSQSSSSSRNMIADNVDVIRLHSVVQGFFVDTLAAAGSLPLWLDHAVRLFCSSFDKAHERILRKANAGLVEDYRVYQIHGFRIQDHVAKHLSHKHVKDDDRLILKAAQQTLDSRITSIREEIERRTPESSHVIAVGKSDVFQTSIFDRTSSSSDTGPETPGSYNRNPSQVSTWGLEPDKGQHESPTNLMHNAELTRQQLEEIYRKNFPLPISEDAGYDSDRESATGTAMAHSMSNQTARPTQDHGGNPSDWEVVDYRRAKPRQLSSPQHRSIRNMERQRYRDSAGAYRALTAADPRLTKENATGSFDKSHNNMAKYNPFAARQSLSSASDAKGSLTQISQNSPPPSRGEGSIQDKQQDFQRPTSRPRMKTGLSSYAAAVAGSTKDTILGWAGRDSSSHGSVGNTTPRVGSSDSGATVDRPSSAIEALQKFPAEVSHSSTSSPTLQQVIPAKPQPIPIPPYPSTPFSAPTSANKDSFPFQPTQSARPRSISSGLNPYPSTIYPRLEGLPPLESIAGTISSVTKPIPVPSSLNQTHLPSRESSDPHSPPFLSLSFPDIRGPYIFSTESSNEMYVPGHPELSQHSLSNSAFLPHKGAGYSSHPLTRDPSGQTANSNQEANTYAGFDSGKRRASLAETEPAPRLPEFSPKIPPTSYQIHERLRRLQEDGQSEAESPRMPREEWEQESKLSNSLLLGKSEHLSSNETIKQSPRLAYARSALIDKLEDWNSGSVAGSPRLGAVDEPLQMQAQSQARRKFNPAAPLFSPSQSYNLPAGVQTPSYLPPVPPLLPAFPMPTTQESFTLESHSSQNLPSSSRPRALSSSSPSQPAPFNVTEALPSDLGSGGGEQMARTTSGGVKIGGQIIEFGDHPEKIDVDVVRARAWRRLLEKERGDREERERRQSDARKREVEDASGEGKGLGIWVDK